MKIFYLILCYQHISVNIVHIFCYYYNVKNDESYCKMAKLFFTTEFLSEILLFELFSCPTPSSKTSCAALRLVQFWRTNRSSPWRRTTLTFVLKILILFFKERSLDLQMFFSWRKATIALPILASISVSVPPCVSMTLPHCGVWDRKTKSSAESRSSIPRAVYCHGNGV